MSDVAEEWRVIPGFPAYEVSNLGRVRSLPHTTEWTHGRTGTRATANFKGRMLNPNRNKLTGYMTVNVGAGTSNVHRLVLLAFVGPAPEGCQACHANGDPADNRLANLRWDTVRANAEDRERHGRTARGERHSETIRAALRRSQL